jgi:glycosyltransferase involved in cell wall biosynthesis
LKILHVFDDYGTPGEKVLPGEGSVPTVVYYLAKHAGSMGHDVTVLQRSPSRQEICAEIDSVKVTSIISATLPDAPYNLIKSPYGLFRLSIDVLSVGMKIVGFLERLQFDVIHFHFPFASCFVIEFRKMLRDRVVYTAHIGEENMRLGLGDSVPPVLRLFSPDLFLMNRIAKTIVLNENLKHMLEGKLVSQDKTVVIPNGIELSDYRIQGSIRSHVRRRYDAENRIIVLFVGSLTPRKGADCLLRAAKMVSEEYSPKDGIIFLLAGRTNLDPEFVMMLNRMALELALSGHVSFLGHISHEELKTYYQASDIFVLPSLGEGDSLAIKEAMAYGKPVIGCNVGGISGRVVDAYNGYLIPTGDAEALANRIVKLAADPSKREAMGMNSRKLIEKEFTWNRITKKYIDVYQSLLTV